MTTFRTALAGAAAGVSLLTLAACATGPASGPAPIETSAAATTAVDEGTSAYGLFLAGDVAFDEGDKHSAADLFAAAAHEDGAQPFLAERAFTSALVAGDVRHAANLAPDLGADSPSIARLGQLTEAVEDLAEGRGRESETLLSKPPLGAPFATAGVLLAPWAAASAGDWKTALAEPVGTGDRLVDEISLLTNALLLERRHRFDASDAAFRKLMAGAAGSGVYTDAYAGFLERRGRWTDAAALYQAALKDKPDNRAMQDGLAHAKSGKAPPAEPTLAQGAAQALLGPTVVLLSEKQPELGLAYLRLVLRLDPDRDEAWVLAGDALVASGDTAAARDAYGHPQAGSSEFIDARARLITTYDNSPADDATVLQIAQDTVKGAPGDDDALTLLADALRINERYAESAKVLDKLIADQGAKASWQLYYMRGVAREQSGDWPSAETDMQTALKLDPDEPEVLNYLGYSWVDRGERLPQAKAMIEKAVAAKPDSGAIVDSLGWAYFRMGDYKMAVAQLEHAAELEPADADINNHLGDAYWRAGRKTEARFQWERVLTLNPDAKLREEVEGKLKTGLAVTSRVAEAQTPAVR